jgi:hypothetical protein
MNLLSMGRIFGALVEFGLPGKQAGQAGQGLIAPLCQEIAMDTLLDCKLVEGLFFFQHLTYEPGFERGGVLFTHNE